MTREFNKQRRDDSRPSFRTTHSNDYGAARPPRPGRPRLNRETVDRAWESGAQHQHADYNPRDGRGSAGYNGRYQRQDRQEPERNSFQRGRGYNNENGNYRNDSRDTPRNGERNRRDGVEPRPYNRNNDRRGPGSSDERYNPHTHDQRDFRPARNTGTPYRDRDQQERGNYEGRRNFGERGNYEGRRNFGERGNYEGRRNFGERGNYEGRKNFEERGNYEGRKNFEDREPRRNDARDNRSGPPARAQRPNGPPSRSNSYRGREYGQGTQGGHRSGPPTQQNDNSSRQGFNSSAKDEMFEGDYEHFTSIEEETPRRAENARHTQRSPRDYKPKPEERHVTPLPDGRVLKGPRSSQRQQAQFWTNVSEDTDELLSNVHTQETEGEQENGQETEQTEKTRRPRPRTASGVVRKRKSSSTGASGPSPKPSQRGFKWPTP